MVGNRVSAQRCVALRGAGHHRSPSGRASRPGAASGARAGPARARAMLRRRHHRIEQSASSAAHFEVGETQSSCVVGGELEVGGLLALERHLHDRVAAGLQDLLVDGLQQRLGRRALPRSCRCRPPSPPSSSWTRIRARRLTAGLDPSRYARLDPSRRRRRSTIAMNRACRRVSSVSSGWKAQASSRPSRTTTGWPSRSASTSTPAPCSSIQGARMKTARSGSGPSPSTRGPPRSSGAGGRRRCGARATSIRPEVVAVER